jgi:hypothetical protein
MIHHERLRPPSSDYPADDWNVVENRFRPEFLTQITALGNVITAPASAALRSIVWLPFTVTSFRSTDYRKKARSC